MKLVTSSVSADFSSHKSTTEAFFLPNNNNLSRRHSNLSWLLLEILHKDAESVTKLKFKMINSRLM